MMCVALALITLGVGPTSATRQALDIIPTHSFPFLTSTTPARGGSTATFTRAGASIGVVSPSTLVYESVGANTAAITMSLDPDSTLPGVGDGTGVALSEAVQYVLLQNKAIDDVAWSDVGTPVVTANQRTDPFGSLTCDSVNDNSAAAVEGRSQAVTIAANTTWWTATAWVNCLAGHTAELDIALTDGAGCTPVAGDAGHTCDGGLTKIVVSVQNAGCETATVSLHPAGDLDSETGESDYCYVQLYNEPFESGRETAVSTAAVDLAVDALSYSSVAMDDTGTVCGWVWPSYDSTNDMGVWEWDNDPTAAWRFEIGTGRILQFSSSSIADGMSTVSTTTISDQTWTHVCATWSQADASTAIYKNGVEVSYSGTPDRTWTAAAVYGTALSFGVSKTRTDGELVLSRYKYWAGRQLSAAKVKALYAREVGAYP